MYARISRLAILLLAIAGPAFGKAPEWLHEVADVPVPTQSPETQAVQLLNEVRFVVTPDGRMHKRVRGVVRILRQDAKSRAQVRVAQDSWRKIEDMRGWALALDGKEPDVRMRDAIETSIVDVAGSELITDLRMKVLEIPEARPGATIGYEYEIELNPLEIADTFVFQDTIPVREARYELQLPPGWNMLPTWLNHAAIQPESIGAQKWRWTVRDVPAIVAEPGMPSLPGVAGHMFLALSPPGAAPKLSTWQGIGGWFIELSRDRRVASPAMRSKVAELVAGASNDLERMQALGRFVQRDVRYVGIQLGIGSFQPHAAADVFVNRYGDCKDKATLLATMLAEIGIEAVPVLVNTDRSRVGPNTPASMQFNHVILAIRLPRDVQSPTLLAKLDQPDGGRLLFFDPTDELTVMGRIRGDLQGTRGLLSFAEGSRLVQLPQLLPAQSGVQRSARLVLDAQGMLKGDVKEKITGQEAIAQRGFIRATRREQDVTKPVEAGLAASLASFRLDTAVVRNREVSDLPLEWDYSVSADSYARRAADLLMVRPRVLGVYATNLPGEDKKRRYDLMVNEPRLNQDEFVIDLPAGYVVDSLPTASNLDVGFASYRSSTEVVGSQLRYKRSYEVRALQVPASGIEDFRRLHREIARDERAVVVLKRAAP
jgi:hypothetical protein